ncbi:hypothetical protein C1H46_037845 [Malus baccata]|uniref:Uncharacterized protein n=1 Tax=Malus baccata TaxID=106549 RepID=A0A540KQZ8_MALBA|nr:hypothetical protein C1H46_037845 [Malus baccata]
MVPSEESRFMKRLGKLFRSGPSRGEAAERSNPNPQLIGDENVLWRALPRSLVCTPTPLLFFMITFS